MGVRVAFPAARPRCRRRGADGVLNDEGAVLERGAVQRTQSGGGVVDGFELDEGEALLQVEADDGSEGGELVLKRLARGSLGVKVDDEEGLAGLRGAAAALVLAALDGAVAAGPLDFERAAASAVQRGPVQGANGLRAVRFVLHEDEGEAPLEVHAGHGAVRREDVLQVGGLAVVLEVADEDGARLGRGGSRGARRGGRGGVHREGGGKSRLGREKRSRRCL